MTDDQSAHVGSTEVAVAEPMSRDKVIRAALAVIDREGLAALNIRRLAAELEVTGGLIYHYVPGKAEILEGVAALVLREVEIPPENLPWMEWVVELTKSFRAAFIRHPNVLPLMMNGLPSQLSLPAYSKSADMLLRGGIPRELVSTVMEGLEAIAIGHAVYSSAALRGSTPNFGEGEREYPPLHEALSAVAMSADDRFVTCIRVLLEGFVPANGAARERAQSQGVR